MCPHAETNISRIWISLYMIFNDLADYALSSRTRLFNVFYILAYRRKWCQISVLWIAFLCGETVSPRSSINRFKSMHHEARLSGSISVLKFLANPALYAVKAEKQKKNVCCVSRSDSESKRANSGWLNRCTENLWNRSTNCCSGVFILLPYHFWGA